MAELVVPLAITVLVVQNGQGIAVLTAAGHDPPVDSIAVGIAPKNVRVLADGVVLPLDDAMPVALMVVEVLLSSGIGSPEAGPVVTVALTRQDADATLRIDLTKPDDQGRLPAVADSTRHMMEALARQLGGPLMIEEAAADKRTVEVRFPVRKPAGPAH